MDGFSNSKEDESILVAVRIRPLSKKEISAGIQSCCQPLGTNNIAIRKGGDANGYLKSQQAIINEYAFDAVFDDDSTQEEVYEKTAKKYVKNVVSGKNVTVFAYGATGAGKTHTMLGNTRVDSSTTDTGPGIIPNAVRDVFRQMDVFDQSVDDENIDVKWTVILSYIEVYNEQVYDLLGGAGKALSVREDKERGIVVVAGMTEQVVANFDEVMVYMTQGNRSRKTEATMANSVSSRSHAVLQLALRRTMLRLDTNKETVIDSKLSLIDLAGSERASATNNRGVRLQEGANINKSLLALANCINALSENVGSDKKSHVNFRDSKLTHLLKSSLEGNCNLIMIANINPSDTTYEDSNNTLKYANRAKNIKVNPTVQETNKETTWLERELRLRQENADLRNRVSELSKLAEAAQAFRENLFTKCINLASLEDILQCVTEFDEEQEMIRNASSGASVSAGSDSDTSFTADAADASSSPATTAGTLSSPEVEDVLPRSEALGRGKRRASMSAISLPAPVKVSTAKAPAAAAAVKSKPAVAETNALPAASIVTAPALVLADDDEEEVTASMRSVTNNARKRRASCMPAPTAVTQPVAAAAAPIRQSARRTSLAPPKPASATSSKAAAEPIPSAKQEAHAVSKIADVTTRVTRRKSLMLSATTLLDSVAAVVAAEVPQPAPVVVVQAEPSVNEEPDVSSEPVVEESVLAEVAPTVDMAFDDNVSAAAAGTRRRSMLRRTSFGGADPASSAATGTSAVAEPARTSNRRRSIAEVTAMLASIDAVQTIVPKSLAEPKASKKRPADETDENAKRRKENAASSSEISPHVWIDI